jgi:hypothetical protein
MNDNFKDVHMAHDAFVINIKMNLNFLHTFINKERM